MGILRGALGKKRTPATDWVKENKPKKIVSKNPCKLSTVPAFEKTQLKTFDNILRPAVGVVASMAKLNNAVQHLIENFKVFGAMTEGIPSIDTDYKPPVTMAGLPTFVVASPEGSRVAKIGAEGVVIEDQEAWNKMTKQAKKVGKLCTSLAEWLKYLSLVMDKHAEHAANKAEISVAHDAQFPELSGEVSPGAPWVGRLVKIVVPSCFGFCKATIEREILLDEMLRRKKAQSMAGRRGMKKSASNTIKQLKKESAEAMQIYNDKDKLRKAFDENDRDRSGQIDFDELSALFKKMNIEKEPHEVEEMLAAADKDGNGTIDFNEFVDVQKQVADAKEAESQTWFTEPNKIQIRKNGCLRADKKHFEFLMYKSSEGSKIRGSGPTIEKKLLKELMEQQKKADPSVKDWAKAVTEAMKMVNLLLIHVRDELTKSAKTNYSPVTVMSKIKAMLSDFGREAAGVTSGRPSIRFQKDFKLLFQGKNPITNIVFVTPDGKDFDFKAKGSGSVGGTMQYIYNVFFNVQHPNNLLNIFGAIAKSVGMLVKDCLKLGLRIANLARQCLPPFPIIPTIVKQVMQVCMKGAMSLDFKIRKIPFKILRGVRSFATFPRVALAFATASKTLIYVIGSMAVDGAQAALTDKTEKVDLSEMGDEYQKGKSRASDAGSVAAEASSKQGELKISKDDAAEEKAGGDDDDDPDDENDPSHAAYDLSDEALETKFAEIDIDCDGFVTPDELKQAILESGRKRSDQDVGMMMKEADADGNGQIDLEEFKSAMRLDTTMAA